MAAKIDGPIAGENYTSDTRNYPWHRPPKKTDYVDIVESAVNKLTKPQGKARIIALLEGGESVIDIVTGITRMNIGEGQIPIDQGVLSAGPIVKLIDTLGEKAGIDYEKGWVQDPPLMTINRARAMQGTNDELPPEEEVQEEPQEDGLMSMQGPASEDAQAEMLGGDGEMV